jgi:hypothetical protein
MFQSYQRRVAGCALAVLLAGAFSAVVRASPILYATPGALYLQDFDELPNAPENTSLGPVSWRDDITLEHWHAQTSINGGAEGGFERMRITHGNATIGAIYSFGATGDFDRALGSIGSTTIGDVVWGVHFRNDTGLTLRHLIINYFGEQWRDAGGVPAQGIDFQYSLNGSDVHGPGFGTAINVDALDFVSPSFDNAAAITLDGNNPANRKLISGQINNINWAPGTELWIRWVDVNHPDADHGLAVDDFAFQALTPEPAAPLAAGLSIAIARLHRRRRRGNSAAEFVV